MKYLLLVACIISGSIKAKASQHAENIFFEKVIRIVVNGNGQACMGRDTFSLEILTGEVQDRLWKSYLGTGKMYDSIHLEFSGQVSMGDKIAATDAVRLAQKRALMDVCLEKNKKLFEKLSDKQQDKIRKQFPILFQENF